MRQITNKDLKDIEKLKEAAVATLEALKEKLEELANNAEEYYEERSEDWQESDNGNNYYAWFEEIRSKAEFEVDGIIDEINEIDIESIQKPERN